MRTVQRTPADRALRRDAGTIAAAMVAVGASFGAITIAYGLPTWVPFLMSTVVFAGGSQFLAIGLLAAGNPLAAVAAGLLLNARHLPFGLAVADAVGTRPVQRILGSHLLTDEVAAFTLAEPDPARRHRVYWIIGTTLFTSWNIGTALGVLLGGATGDPDALGLDAAFPAALLALIMPALADRTTRTVALTGAAVAVLATPILPAGLPVICALLGLLTVVRPRRRAALPPPASAAPASAGPAPAAPAPAEPSRAEPSRAGRAVGEGSPAPGDKSHLSGAVGADPGARSGTGTGAEGGEGRC
ncbi:hypothetical protein GCM10010172_59890 [Paractinoplanes ferrugineus]|uniref:4-azaleucine resistance transporter AzlC n=1 Tax=Paractinoplanes ferrugineus TaxID=113564 RepID=A0A919JC51_9ACTN|nr:AzlC family ABC transporter permease [Actinoplanes ferrugineus]GIE14451.1 hypothetical protein Afe05nite_62910 [Actinoplanes ferrugineus]